jgi:hypothetical protein
VQLARVRFDWDTVTQFQSFQPEPLAIAKCISNGNIIEKGSDFQGSVL